jgi:multifunctional methyltransferase subunit TRM112
MKILTVNFLTCAIKTCKTSPLSFPLHFRDAHLQRTEIDFNPLFIRNILPRINWDALTTTAGELGLEKLCPPTNPSDYAADEDEAMKDENDAEKGEQRAEKRKEIPEDVLKQLHALLLETSVTEGKLVCGNCGFEYPIKDGVANFLLPAHLV